MESVAKLRSEGKNADADLVEEYQKLLGMSARTSEQEARYLKLTGEMGRIFPEPRKKKKIERLDPDELKKFAVDLFSGKIFTSFHIRPGDERMGVQIFVPLLFLDDAGRKDLKKRKPHVFYEYLSEAGPRSINGYPIFMSVRTLGKEDWDAAKVMAVKMEEAAKSL